MKVLVVDDDAVDRERLKRLLKGPDIAITEATTVDEGVEAYNLDHFDMVLLDYRMPQRDGIEMLRELRCLPRESSVAIVMMSTCEDEELALECLKSGAQDFIPKNEISRSRLMRAIAHSHTRFELEKELWASYRQVKQMAERDALTGLANRYLFDETLKLAVTGNVRNEHKVALILFDIDNFKFINDTYGHDIGDLMLKRAVDRVRSCLRGDELFCRLGGDEFAIAVANCKDIKTANSIATRVKNIFIKPYQIEGQNISSSISIGIAIHPDNANTASDLYKQADIAMYRAKRKGKNCICFFESQMQKQFSHRFLVEQDLRDSDFDNDLFLLYQPILSGKTQQIIGGEALLRWHYNGKVNTPDKFISIAEDSHLILEIGEWVASNAFKQLAEWDKSLSPDLFISINLSPKQLSEKNLVNFISSEIDKYQLNPANIQLEITETAFLGNASQIIRSINGLHELGCRVALDDFGTGFSSISHLRVFPIDTVKIDKSILPEDSAEGKSNALFSGLCTMLHALGLKVTVEGVETKEQLELCSSMHIDNMQGYFFSKPISVEAFSSYFNTKKKLRKVNQK